MNDVREEESEPMGRWPSRFAPNAVRVNESSPTWANLSPANNPVGHNSAEASRENNGHSLRCSIRLTTTSRRMTSRCCERLVLQAVSGVNLGRKRSPAGSWPGGFRRKLLPLAEQDDSIPEKAWDQISQLLDAERERNY